MKIVAENQTSSLAIVITATDEVPEQMYSSMMLWVSVTDEGFTGARDGVCVLAEDLAKFAADLNLCEQTRKGKASLSSISPGELELTIEQSDGWGHFLLRYTLSKPFCSLYSRSGLLDKSVSGGFDLDASSFKELVEEFDNLINVETPP